MRRDAEREGTGLADQADSPGAGARTDRRGRTGGGGPIRVPKTAEVLAAKIRKMIIRGEVREGDFLQPEGQLVEIFGTSRPTVREAFRILENEQLISVVRGSRSGARVHAPNAANVARYAGMVLQAQGAKLSDVYLARVGVEPFAARLAAERASDDALAAFADDIKRTLALADAPEPGPAPRLAVVGLHERLVDLADSPTLRIIWAMIEGVVAQHMVQYPAPREAPEEVVRRYRMGLRSFGRLHRLLAARDANGAEAHWREHMRNANRAWLAGYGEAPLIEVLD